MSVRLGEDDRLCLLVMIGVREDGENELLAVEDGYRESTDSWAAVFRDARRARYAQARDRRRRAGRAQGRVPDAREQRCWHDCPAEHRRHLRTTNPIESSFATLKPRTRVMKGAGSKKAALAMAYRRLDAASQRWRRFNGHELLADLLAGVKFKDGIRVPDDENHHDEMTHEEVAA